MAGHFHYTLGGSDTVEVSQPVAQGQGVEVDPNFPGTPTAPAKVRPWGAGSVTRVGVAQIPGLPTGTNPPLNLSPIAEDITVLRGPIGTRLWFASACGYRKPVIAAADGKVVQAPDNAPFHQIVGYCDEKTGVASGKEGRVELI